MMRVRYGTIVQVIRDHTKAAAHLAYASTHRVRRYIDGRLYIKQGRELIFIDDYTRDEFKQHFRTLR